MTAQNEQLKAMNNTEEGRQALFQSMKEQQGVNTDPVLNQRVDRIMANLSQAIAQVDPSINDMPYNYYINPDTSFNAACSLGHNMTINTGIFSLLTTDDEIAVVLGHEMGHGQKNHVLKGYQKSIPVDLLATAAAAGGGYGAALGAGVVANYIDKVHISKPLEWEADNLAFEYITHTDYNIGATAAAKKISEYSNGVVTVADGVVKIHDKEFVTPVSISSMSGAERSYFVAGNLARYYNRGTRNIPEAHVVNGTVYVEDQAIMTPAEGDLSAQELADRFNKLRK